MTSRGQGHEPVGQRIDILSKWCLAVILVVPSALILLSASPLGTDFLYVMMGIPVLLFLGAAAAIGALVAAAGYFRRKNWRKFATMMVPVLAVLAAACNPLGFVRFCNGLGDYVHLALMQRYYVQRALAEQPRPPRLVVFNRGGMVWFSSGIVYDESDEITLPKSRQSTAWKTRAANTELTCGYGATHLWGHFYSAGIYC